jgi:hypothetical protein
MTIKEKVRIAWEQDLEVEIDGNAGVWYGYIVSYNMDSISVKSCNYDENGEIIPNPYKVMSYHYKDITGIRFLDGPCEGDRVACKHDYEVMVGFMKPGFFRCKHCGEIHPLIFKQDSQPESCDITKERWHAHEWDQGERHRIQVLRPDIEWGLDIPIQVAEMTNKVRADLAAAAPELADMMREEVNDMAGCNGQIREEAIKRISLLRKLGIPNVAPWYKGDG